MVREQTVQLATFVALLIVMVASILSAAVNWQTWRHRKQVQELYLDWQAQRDSIERRLAAVQTEQAKQQRPLPPPQ